MTKLIPLSTHGKKYAGRYFAIVDDDDAERLEGLKCHVIINRDNLTPYAGISINGKNISLHRFILNAPPGFDVDHINGNGLDDRKENIRLATRSQNQGNRRKMTLHETTTKYKGVFGYKTFYASITHNGKSHWLGSFTTAIEAARAYDRKALELHGDFARTNFPKENYLVEAAQT